MRDDFEQWLSEFRPSIADYGYYVDFGKVCDSVDEIRVELNIMNSLLGSDDVENDFVRLAMRYPEILRCVPILVAVRREKIYAQDADGGFEYVFNEETDIDSAVMFMTKSGLFDMLEKGITHDLVDYVLGVEVGLDSNARKNRGGHLMEDYVESFIQDAGFVKDATYFKEMYTSEIEKRWDLDLATLTNDGTTSKRFDFVLDTGGTVFGIETNFYASSGSKLNETARSYKELALEARDIEGFDFVWITDGIGWQSARGNLLEARDAGTVVYNLVEVEDGALGELGEGGAR